MYYYNSFCLYFQSFVIIQIFMEKLTILLFNSSI